VPFHWPNHPLTVPLHFHPKKAKTKKKISFDIGDPCLHDQFYCWLTKIPK
jgi:hypothetical protein